MYDRAPPNMKAQFNLINKPNQSIKLLVNIADQVSSKKDLVDYKYNKKVIFKYSLIIKNSQYHLNIYSQNTSKNHFKKTVLGSFIYDYSIKYSISNIDINFLRANGDERILRILEEGTEDLINRIYKYCVNMRNDKSSSIGKIEVYDKTGNNPKLFYISSCCSGCYCRVLEKEYYYLNHNNKNYLFKKNRTKKDKITQILEETKPSNSNLVELDYEFIRKELCNMS
mgnify:CR=1 FL=1